MHAEGADEVASQTPVGTATEYDFDRLETAVEQLADAHHAALTDNVALRGNLEDQNQRIRELEGQLLESNQRRQDVVKRIDELISQIDLLESQLGPPLAGSDEQTS